MLLAVFTLVFLMSRASPGGPWDPGIPVPPEVLQNLREFYGVDEPLYVQYWQVLSRILFDGDLGPSYLAMRRDVSTMILEALPISLQLGIASVTVAIVLGVGLGMIAAWRQNTYVDYGSMGVVMFGLSVPPYVTTPLLVIIFAIHLQWLPSNGWNGIFDSAAIIPIVALALGPAAGLARYTRNSVLDVLGLDHVRTADSKGLSTWVVGTRHVLKNALLPIITIAGVFVSRILTHTFYVEWIYGIPGMGRLAVEGIFGRDYPVIIGVSLVVAFFVGLTNLAVDLLYTRADPRVRFE